MTSRRNALFLLPPKEVALSGGISVGHHPLYYFCATREKSTFAIGHAPAAMRGYALREMPRRRSLRKSGAKLRAAARY